ncbi:hypothetical protein [Fusobacterium nucleatum]|uniref:hypothetical protein n=1 Tax=Fusobacterium nucleatum TaxID=851 RepID=UPI00235EB8B3|nr:hypothetical protein [Fusobacterium nucleatum]WDD87922.1 hypothetical protein PSR68_05875 [Fusobacterium nucleatum]
MGEDYEKFDHTKVLLFFSSKYTSTDLRLFGFEGNYYRDFKIKKIKGGIVLLWDLWI